MADAKRCEYCSGKRYILEHSERLSRKGNFYAGLDVGVYDDLLFVEGCADTYEPNYIEVGAKINFCPMCGLKIGKEDKC